MSRADMKAAVYSERGAADRVLQVGTIPVPEPGPGEVLVRIAYSGINPSDWKVRGRVGLLLEGYQIPHQDGSGEVVSVGAGVDRDRIGQAVWIFHAARGREWGTAAEFVPVPAAQAIPLPAGVRLRDAAMLGIPYLTAAASLRLTNRSMAGKTVLVQGGAGAVGSATIQFARWARARSVIATASSEEKCDFAISAGAHTALDYTAPDFADQLVRTAPEGLDQVVELALGTNIAAVSRAVKRASEVVVYGADEGDAWLPTRALLDTGLTVRFLMVFKISADEEGANAALVNDLLGDGARPLLDAWVYDLDDIVESHEHAETTPFGRVLVRVGADA